MIRTLMLMSVVTVGLVALAPETASAGHRHRAQADCCAPEPVCCAPAPVCEPPPVEVCLCVVDPCTGCTYEVAVCVPACCAGEAPCLAGWKNGIFGRKVLSYQWSCGHRVEVVITKHGKTIVRD